MQAFRTLLIANRGEIAVRIARTARALGTRTVAVYSDADAGALHTRVMDLAVRIGPAPVVASYLSIPNLLAAARDSGAEAVHPGYGFLAENADFAAACVEAGLVFVGPPAEAIRLMGNKRLAKERLEAAGVPMIPGYHGGAQDEATLAAEAARIGYPVMVKAAAGGGGRGMRRVAQPAQLADALRAARGEAERAFGSGELLLERALEGARHVEVQVFADAHGHVLHLGERDCSLQRRHQKLVEEAPSPAVDGALRERMGSAAVQAAREIGYVGAGTVEFMLAADGAFYFLEMNTRLQVEHAVTEAVTGLDLVEWQLRVAVGEPLPLTQAQVLLRGHAIEARLYGEDPYAGFLPQSGTVLDWALPQGPGLRVDHGLAAGMEIGTHYDALLAKLVAWGADREEARQRLLAGLESLRLLGIGTNGALLRQLLAQEAFVRGAATTHLVDDLLAAGALPRPEAPEPLWALAAVLLYLPAGGSPHPAARWALPGPPVGLRVALHVGDGGTERRLRVAWLGREHYAVRGEHDSAEVAILERHAGVLRYSYQGVQREAHVACQPDRVWIAGEGFCGAFEEIRVRSAAATGSTDARLTAPMSGRVLEVRAREGQSVRRGECLVTLEAMKLQHELGAPRDGTVLRVPIQPGQQVALRQLLVELEPLTEVDPAG